MTDVDLEFTAPTLPLSVNRKGHWAAARKRLKPWQDAAWAVARNALVRGHWHPPEAVRQWTQRGWACPITVQVVLPFRGNYRRDAHNYTGTNVKAIVDGLVRAGIVPDDNPDWVTVLDPEFRVVKDRAEPLTVTVRIRPRETP